jgi:hypothetical protein
MSKLHELFGWTRHSYYLLSAFLLICILIIYVWWPLVEEYLSYMDGRLPWSGDLPHDELLLAQSPDVAHQEVEDQDGIVKHDRSVYQGFFRDRSHCVPARPAKLV